MPIDSVMRWLKWHTPTILWNPYYEFSAAVEGWTGIWIAPQLWSLIGLAAGSLLLTVVVVGIKSARRRDGAVS